jgi:hypothetical protein
LAADARSAGDAPDLRPPQLSVLPWIMQEGQEAGGEVVLTGRQASCAVIMPLSAPLTKPSLISAA